MTIRQKQMLLLILCGMKTAEIGKATNTAYKTAKARWTTIRKLASEKYKHRIEFKRDLISLCLFDAPPFSKDLFNAKPEKEIKKLIETDFTLPVGKNQTYLSS